MNRKPLDYNSFSNLASQMIENNMAASLAVEDLIKNHGKDLTLTLLMILDDMNIRGVQLGNLYKLCDQDSSKLYEKILSMQKKDIDELNRLSISLTPYKAIYEGSKEDREANPQKYFFTSEELQGIRRNSVLMPKLFGPDITTAEGLLSLTRLLYRFKRDKSRYKFEIKR